MSARYISDSHTCLVLHTACTEDLSKFANFSLDKCQLATPVASLDDDIACLLSFPIVTSVTRATARPLLWFSKFQKHGALPFHCHIAWAHSFPGGAYHLPGKVKFVNNAEAPQE